MAKVFNLRWVPRWVSGLCPSVVDQGLTQGDKMGWSPGTLKPYCPKCGQTLAAADHTEQPCPGCLGQTIPWDRLVRVDQYCDPVRRWIIAMKFDRAWSWGPWFGAVLADQIDPRWRGSNKVVVCPVPMHWLRRVRRGYNQAGLIAGAVAKQRGWTCESLLRRTRYTPPQTSMSQTQRLKNVRDSIAAVGVDLSGWHVWVVDDVKTTGATLTRCVQLLRKAGAESVNVAVVAVAGGGGGGASGGGGDRFLVPGHSG